LRTRADWAAWAAIAVAAAEGFLVFVWDLDLDEEGIVYHVADCAI
jgi:hypothetical protein